MIPTPRSLRTSPSCASSAALLASVEASRRGPIVNRAHSKAGVGLAAALGSVVSGLVRAAAPAEPLTEDGCSAAIDQPGSTEPRFQDIPGLSILEWDPRRPLRIPGVGPDVRGILCWRSDAKFSANDYLVALAGLPLYVKTDFIDATRNRTLVLENTKGGFRIRLLSGPEFSNPEFEEIRRLIKHYNAERQRHEAQLSTKPKRPAVTL